MTWWWITVPVLQYWHWLSTYGNGCKCLPAPPPNLHKEVGLVTHTWAIWMGHVLPDSDNDLFYCPGVECNNLSLWQYLQLGCGPPPTKWSAEVSSSVPTSSLKLHRNEASSSVNVYQYTSQSDWEWTREGQTFGLSPSNQTLPL